MTTLATLGYCGIFLLLWAVLRGKRSNNLPFPPGPKGHPLIGNIYDIPRHYAWLTYHKWARTYGNILHVRTFGADTIILNSLEASIELLDKRSSDYSDRPRMVGTFSAQIITDTITKTSQVMADELMDWDWDFAHMPYTDRWR